MYIHRLCSSVRRMYQQKSLSTQMSWSISIFSILLLVVIGFAAYRIALEESQEVINSQMEHMAYFLEQNNPSLRTSTFNPKHHYGEVDFFIDIVAKDHLQQSGLTDGYLMPYSDKSYVKRQKTSRGTLIIYVKPIDDKQIQISQLNHVRVNLAKELAINMLLPYLFFVPFGILGLYKLIQRHLRPLFTLKEIFSVRHPSDLSPIHVQQLPAEISPAINELNYLFKRIEEAQIQQKSFVANAAHELRTPLTAINLQTNLLSKLKQNTAQYDENMVDLRLSLQRMIRLVDQLMKLAHQDDMAVNELEQMNVVDVLRTALNQLSISAKEKNIQMQFVVDHYEEVFVWATQSILETIFLNLIDNAIKYNRTNGQILVRVYVDHLHTTVEFHDAGPGIDESNLKKVKERFVRLESTQHQVVGSGLGLSIVEAALKLIDGQLSFTDSSILSGLNAKVMFKNKNVSPNDTVLHTGKSK